MRTRMRLSPKPIRRLAFFAVLSTLTAFCYADDSEHAEFTKQFEQTAKTFLETYCTTCHAGDEPEAGMPLDNFDQLREINSQRPVWLHVIEKIRSGEMPPEDEAQPTKEEKTAFIGFIEPVLNAYDCSKHVKPGRVTVRRLNRAEYNNTIRDLVGVDFSPAKDFPADTVGAGFDNLGEALSLPPLLMEKYLDAAEEIMRQAETSERFHDRWIKGRKREGDSDDDAAKSILSEFALKAFRRPLRDGELDGLVDLLEVGKNAELDFESSIRFAMQGVLISPRFLFRLEVADDDNKTDQARPLNDYELATRLSYFLWSTMPDQELFDLAEQKKLIDDAVYDQQVIRMLKDKRADTLTKNFAGQWLELRNLAKLTPSKEHYPNFDEDLRLAMRRETELFFENIMRQDRSVLEFVDSDYTFWNERLARHYGNEQVHGSEFRRVSLNDDRRGGILTHASILTLTSNPTRTSPVKRGKWILDNLLGEPPPPPPPGVEELSDDDTELLGTLRERMQQHRENPSCAVCHKKMDALGFGFENFDGIGAWRDADGRFKIDASGELPGKLGFRGPGELRKILKTTKKDQFVRCLTQKMLTYALGRELSTDDRCTIDVVTKELRQGEFRFSSLVLAIARSDAFRIRGELGDSR